MISAPRGGGWGGGGMKGEGGGSTEGGGEGSPRGRASNCVLPHVLIGAVASLLKKKKN